MIGSDGLFNAYRNSLSPQGAGWPDGDELRTLNQKVAEAPDLMNALSEISGNLGFDYVSYTLGSSTPCPMAGGGGLALTAQIRSNYPCEWTSHYDKGNYTSLDPIVQYAKRARLPFLWGLDEDLVHMPRDMREIMAECGEFGIRSGVAIPAHGPGDEFMLLSLCTSGSRSNLLELVNRHYNLLWLIAPTVHLIAIQQWLSKSGLDPIVLTERERECLYWTAQGKTSWEISRIINRSKATVEYHLQRAMRKVSAITKGQAAAIAVREGLL